jgi:hypothetical protein
MQIRPSGRYERAGSIGQHQCQVQFPITMAPAEHFERRPLKGMAGSNEGYLIGIAIEMMAVVGSLSSGPSTASITPSYENCWPDESPMV